MTLTVKQYTGDIWDMHGVGWHIVIPTNLYVKDNGEAVMGRGLALQATQRWPNLKVWYGYHLKEHVRRTPEGRNPRMEDINPPGLLAIDNERNFICLPVKTSWNQGARKTLIEQSLKALADDMRKPILLEASIAIPRIGCGNGLLNWEEDVKPLVREFLISLPDEARARVCIVHPSPDLPPEPPPNWS